MRFSSALAAVFVGAAFQAGLTAALIHFSLIEVSEYQQVFTGIISAVAAILTLLIRKS